MTEPNSAPLIEIKNLRKVYQTPAGDFTAVNGINVEVQRGEFVAIIGKSGSGKSTFINMITGIDRPTSGEIWIDGAPVHSFNEWQMAAWRGRNLGIVFQFFQLFPTLTILENIILPMELNKLYSKNERKERAMHLLEKVEMSAQAHKLPSAISGGQQQRVAIARALANDPPLLVADEPTGNLDSKTADKIFSLFEDLVAAGTTILMVTHDSDLARRVNRTILISDGEVVNEYLVRALSTLTQDQLVEISRTIQPQMFPPNSAIVRQGEKGDKFYILLDGKADVYINTPGKSEIQVNQLKPGQYFGEMALLGEGVRRATVKAAHEGPASVLALDEKAFNSLIDDSRSLREELMGIVERRNTYHQLQTLSSLDEHVLNSILKDKQPVTYQEGHEIIKQGEVGDTFYLLLDGQVDILVKDDGGGESLVNQISRGSFFGEMALMGNKRRNATVRVSKEHSAKLIELSISEFDRLEDSSEDFKAHVYDAAGARKRQLENTRGQGIET
ncbi:MAG TPA: ATP-binding cassette domain-containing protein [Anaerolineales bacterium]|jgi:ABC-type lipoprotein export system ATPase subunit/CRP-like cAMP-binding protein|nr:ATP-binding cassette domain-containing protein [Anaerolineales bacterium]